MRPCRPFLRPRGDGRQTRGRAEPFGTRETQRIGRQKQKASSDSAGAYFHPSEVGIEGTTKGHSREDKEDPAAEIRFCANCGSTTHFILTASAVSKFGNVQMGVNMRLADEKDLAGIELRYPDGRAWSGKGGFGYVQEARIGPISDPS